MLIRLVGALSFLFLVSCATKGAVSIPDLNRPMADLQRIAAKSLPLGLRKQSANGREFFSHYFETKNRKFQMAQRGGERRYAHILVLGDRRPYKIDVVVHLERVDPKTKTYVEVGADLRLAKVIRQRIAQHLSKRREDLNFIDDFRVF